MLGDRSRRGVALSTASTVVVLAALAAIVLLAPGSAQVRHTFFNPTDMWRALVGDPKAGYYSVGEALWLNIRMFIAAEVLILIVALVVAVVRQSTGPVDCRTTATTRATMRISTSAATNIRMFSHSASPTE